MSQTSLKQKKKNDSATKYSKDNLETEKRRESEKSVRLSTQGSQELLPKTESRGYVVRSQWSGTSRNPSSRVPSVEEPRSKSASLKVPTSSTTSRTSSASHSQQESQHELSQHELSGHATPPTPPVPHTPPAPLDSSPPTPPEPQPQPQSLPASRRSTKMHENHDNWGHSMMRDRDRDRDRDARDAREARESRDSRDTRDSRDAQQRDYPRTPPLEWKPYSQRRTTYNSQDRDYVSDMARQREEENEDEEAYWSSVRTLYEKNPGCSRPRPAKPKHALTIAVSSRALFNMGDGRKIYEEEGLEKYMEYQLCNENVILTPGPAFRFVKALQHVNARLRDLYPEEHELFDIVLMTNNHAQVGVRLINSVNHYGLLIDRFCLTGGKSPVGYLKAYLTNFYLSADYEKVQEALQEGIASATMFDGGKDMSYCDSQLRVAFDGDSILFTEEMEYPTKEHGLEKFFQHETQCETKPIVQGPLKCFLEELGRLQKKFYAKDQRLCCPIRTYLVTARSAASSGARVLKMLRRWGLEIDEALFLAGASKGPILVKIRPHIFFDDRMFRIEGAQKFGTNTPHVPYSITQK